MTYPPYHPQPYGYPGYPQRRSAPFSVQVVALFLYLGGFLTLLGALLFGALAVGALNLPAHDYPRQYQELVAGLGVGIAVVLLLIACFDFLIARKLQRGRQWARVLVLVFCALGVLGVGLELVGLVQAGADSSFIASSAGSLIGPVLGIVLLNTPAARSWFRYGTY